MPFIANDLWKDLEEHLKAEERKKKFKRPLNPRLAGQIERGKEKERRLLEKQLFDLYGCKGRKCDGECLFLECAGQFQDNKNNKKNRNSLSHIYRDDVSFVLRAKIAFWSFLAKIFRVRRY